MTFFEWSEAMSVGVPTLDSDHKALINLINALHEDVERGETSTRLDEVFDQLDIYVDYHFAREERVMRACSYPATDSHREAHRAIARSIQRIQEQRNSGEIQIEQDLLNFLKDWLNHHILLQDIDYKKYAMRNPLALDAAENFGPGLSDEDWMKFAEHEASVRRTLRKIETVMLPQRILEWQVTHPSISYIAWSIVWIFVMAIVYWPNAP